MIIILHVFVCLLVVKLYINLHIVYISITNPNIFMHVDRKLFLESDNVIGEKLIVTTKLGVIMPQK